MQVKIIAFLQYFRPSLSYHWSLGSLFCLLFEWLFYTGFTVNSFVFPSSSLPTVSIDLENKVEEKQPLPTTTTQSTSQAQGTYSLFSGSPWLSSGDSKSEYSWPCLQINISLWRESVNIFLSTSLNICFGPYWIRSTSEQVQWLSSQLKSSWTKKFNV